MQRSVGLRHSGAAWRLDGVLGAALLALFMAGCASPPPAPPPPSIVGLWTAQEIAGAAVAGDTRVTLSLYGDGKAVGRAGCNSYFGAYRRAGDTLTFGPLASTKMACAPEIMSLEQVYLETLTATARYERRPDGALVLVSESGAQILFRREEPAALGDARARGIDFRAIGQEPGWVLELTEGDHIAALLDYGATTLLFPTPSAETGADGAVTYEAATDTDHLLLTIRSKACVDAMSGEPHPSAVELAVNDKIYRGCGDWLD